MSTTPMAIMMVVLTSDVNTNSNKKTMTSARKASLMRALFWGCLCFCMDIKDFTAYQLLPVLAGMEVLIACSPFLDSKNE